MLHKLRAIVLGVRSDGLVSANEEFTAWLRGNAPCPLAPTTNMSRCGWSISRTPARTSMSSPRSTSFAPGRPSADLILLVNGFPLVLVEAKTPVRNAVSWVDGALQVHNDYERFVPELFACNVFSVATEGKDLRYGSIHAGGVVGAVAGGREFTSPARRRNVPAIRKSLRRAGDVIGEQRAGDETAGWPN